VRGGGFFEQRFTHFSFLSFFSFLGKLHTLGGF
jgi:hypothetical protein